MNEDQMIAFYLTYQNKLTKEFFVLQEILSKENCILVPVQVDQLQSLSFNTNQEHIIVLNSITKSEELKKFNKYARHLLKYVLKSKRISFFNLSSFRLADDSKLFYHFKNYFYIPLPVDANMLSKKLVKYFQLKQSEKIAWPGGKRAGVSSLGV